jgi:multiple sugar transport system permease protein
MPVELEDAARIDGAGSWRIFTAVLLPLSKPALGALALFTFQSHWNEFTWPLIVMTKQDRLTLPVALSLIRGNYASDSFGPIMAGAVVSAIPLLVVFIPFSYYTDRLTYRTYQRRLERAQSQPAKPKSR